MCGIAGVIGTDRDRVAEATRRMTDAQAHRGPDADGVEVHPFGDKWLGLGHRRLAILDLSPLGRQPMAHSPTGGRIVFNGEVFNFPTLRRELEAAGDRFISGSDTEMLLAGLARHGPGFVRRLEGMYAFAHLDPRGPTLTLARDPAGIKPLYVAHTPDGLAFASEVRAVLAGGLVPPGVSPAAIAGLLAYGSVPQPLTLFDRVRMFPPGAWQTLTPAALSPPTVWWNPPQPAPSFVCPDLVSDTRLRLDEAVRDHLLSDVPVGVFLSAGIDSTAVAALVARHSTRVRAFTVAVSDQPEFDELSVAADTARRLGLTHTPIQIPTAEAEQAALDWLAAADQPSLDGLNTFIISRAVRRAGVTVALSGLGADELFGGYETFRDVPKLARLRRALGWLPAAGRRAVAGVLAAHRTQTARDKLSDLLGGPNRIAALTLRRRRVLSDRQMVALGLGTVAVGLTADWLPPEAAAGLPPAGVDPGWAVSVTESTVYQSNTLLRDADANSMAHGLELRVPFLDQRLLDALHRLPGAVRFPRNKPPKWLLREAVADLLPPPLATRPKTGFQLPTRRWMVGPLRPLCEAGLATLSDSGLVRPDGVRAVWAAFLADPEGQAWSRAFTLVVLGDYLQRCALPIK